jgi:uncharacterized protein
MAAIFVDTSAIYALLDRDDANHTAAKARLRTMKKQRIAPVLSNFVVAESHALLLTRLGADVARRWLLGNVWRVDQIIASDEQKARDIIRSHVDKTYSYTDASSFALMERLGIERAFAFDRHFKQYGFELL